MYPQSVGIEGLVELGGSYLKVRKTPVPPTGGTLQGHAKHSSPLGWTCLLLFQEKRANLSLQDGHFGPTSKP